MGKGFFNNSAKASLIKRVTLGERVIKYPNSVTSFMDDPILQSLPIEKREWRHWWTTVWGIHYKSLETLRFCEISNRNSNKRMQIVSAFSQIKCILILIGGLYSKGKILDGPKFNKKTLLRPQFGKKSVYNKLNSIKSYAFVSF